MMEEQALSPPLPKTTADYKSAIERCLAEMRLMQEQMDEERTVIERLKTETQAVKTGTDALLSRIRAQLDALQTAV